MDKVTELKAKAFDLVVEIERTEIKKKELIEKVNQVTAEIKKLKEEASSEK